MACADSMVRVKKPPQNVTMLQRVMIKLKEDQQESLEYSGTYLDKAAKYTGLQTKVLEDLKNNKVYETEFKEIDRAVIYEELTSFYLNKKIIPTTRQLFEALYKKIPPYVDIKSFRKTLVKMGFVWKRVRNYDLVVIEKPTVVFERYEYLKNIINYRHEGKPIYFIDENALDLENDYFTLDESIMFSKKHSDVFQKIVKVIYAVSKKGIHAVKYIDSFDEDTFMDWLSNEFLPTLEVPSVIVFNQAKHHCEQTIEPPNKESVKYEICKWLEYHNIPFDSNMSKYELLTLCEKFTDLEENMYTVDRTLTECGHVPLRIPDCIKKLTPANLICKLIKENKDRLFNKDECSEAAFVKAVEKIHGKFFVKYDKYIVKHEKDIFMKDTKIDNVYDDLLERMKITSVTRDIDSDIPSCSDSD